MKLKKLLIFFFLLSITVQVSAQRSLYLSDTAFYRMVLLYHPVAKQAGLLVPGAAAELRIARGLFDPVFSSDYSTKEYDGKEYWRTWESALVVPVFPGLDLKAGYEKNEGDFLDPENKTPKDGLVSMGVKVPLGQGLFIDERRNALGQAKLFSGLADAERRKMLNKLMLEATKEYYDWYYNYSRYQQFEEFLRLSIIRFEAIRERVKFGDLPAIDSLEALMEVENRTLLRNQALVDYKSSQLTVSNFMWTDELLPLQVTDSLLPFTSTLSIESFPLTSLDSLLKQADTNHPDLLSTNIKLEQLDYERRWAAEKLKPKLNLEYNFLSDTDPDPYYGYNFGEAEDYKFGVNFRMPLFLRAERGKLTQTKLKIEQTQYQLVSLQREISNDLRQAWNEVNIFYEQVNVQNRQLVLAEKMLSGETERFTSGESSLFLVNTRESNLINNRVRLAELQAKYHKSKAFLYWSAGSLSEVPVR